MPHTLAYHHTSLEASTEEELDHAISRWQSQFERELSEHRRSPSGTDRLVHDCHGTHTVRSLPSWLPERAPPPHRLAVRFTAQKVAGPRWIGHLCAELLDTLEARPPAAKPA
jgi:hypothetical protein